MRCFFLFLFLAFLLCLPSSISSAQEGATLDGRPKPRSKRVTGEWRDKEAYLVVARIFFLAGVDGRWDGGGDLTHIDLKLRDEPLDSALEKVFEQLEKPWTFVIDKGRYRVLSDRTAERLAQLRKEARLDPEQPHLVVQSGHPAPIVAVAISPDGRLLASGCEERVVTVWDASTERALFTLPGRLSPQCFSPDGKTLATGVGEELALWNLSNGEENSRFLAHLGTGFSRAEAVNTPEGTVRFSLQYVGIHSYAWFKQEKTVSLVTSGWDFKIKGWNPRTGKQLWEIPTPNLVYNLTVNPAGTMAACWVAELQGVHKDRPTEKVLLIDLQKGRIARTIDRSHPIFAAAFNPQKEQLALLDNQRGIEFWNLRERKSDGVLSGGFANASARCALTFSADGKRICAGTEPTQFKIWNVETGAEVGGGKGHQQDAGWTVAAAAFMPSGKKLALGTSSLLSDADKVNLWDLESNRSVKWFSGNAQSVNQMLVARDGGIIAGSEMAIRIWKPTLTDGPQPLAACTPMALSHDGKTLVARVGFNGLAAWEYPSLTQKWFQSGVEVPWTPEALVFSPKDDTLAICAGGNAIRLLNMSNGSPLKKLEGHADTARWVDYSSDGKVMASIGGGEDQCIKLWDTETGEAFETLYLPKDAKIKRDQDAAAQSQVAPLVIVPDGAVDFATYPTRQLMAVDVEGGVTLWDTDTRKPLTVVERGGSRPIFSPGGKFLATVRNNTIRVWSLDALVNGTVRSAVRALRGAGDNIRFSPKANQMVTWRTNTADLLLWTQNVLAPKHLVGHTGRIEHAAFTPDGTRLVTNSQDGTIRVWDTKDGTQLVGMVAVGTRDWVLFTPDNYYYASKGAARASVSIRIGEESFSFQQSDLQLNRPDLVLKRLGRPEAEVAEAYTDVQRRWSRCEYQPNVSAIAKGAKAPTLTLTDELPSATNDRKIPVAFVAHDARYPLKSLHVLVNDVPVQRSKGTEIPGSKDYADAFQLELSEGVNRIQAYVRNSVGLESKRLLGTVVYTGKPRTPDLYLVSVGISEHPVQRLKLRYAAKDATDLTTFLESLANQPVRIPATHPGIALPPGTPAKATQPISAIPRPTASKKVGSFPQPPLNTRRKAAPRTAMRRKGTKGLPTQRVPLTRRPLPAKVSPRGAQLVRQLNLRGIRGAFDHAYIQLLLDREATRENIRAARKMLEKSQADDVVVVFVAGHGILVSNERYQQDYHLVTADCTEANLREQAMPYEELDYLLDGIPARRKLMLMDSCHSGESEVDSGDVTPTLVKVAGASKLSKPVAGAVDSDVSLRDVDWIPDTPVAPRPMRRKLNNMFADLRQQSGAFVVAAAEWQQTAGEGNDGLRNGLFTYVALQGLSTGEADTSKDGIIRVSELVRYVADKVTARTQGKQIPTTRFENESDDFVFCRAK